MILPGNNNFVIIGKMKSMVRFVLFESEVFFFFDFFSTQSKYILIDLYMSQKSSYIIHIWNFFSLDTPLFFWSQHFTGPHTDGGCVIRHANATLRYMYEYMGCTSRLVITPLTVKAWLTITGAIHLKLGEFFFLFFHNPDRT